MTEEDALCGRSLIGHGKGSDDTRPFHATRASLGGEIPSVFFPASPRDIEKAAALAAAAFPVFAAIPGRDRAVFLRSIGEQIGRRRSRLIERAGLETGLPAARLDGEINRTIHQLGLFADLLEEGSWVDARIETALPDRKPLPRADHRSMLSPLGPVAVFGASNFPLAFSVAGGDTASALAAGCPVLVKAHSAHPGTSLISGEAVVDAARSCGMPEGVFSLLFGSGSEVGTALVCHPEIKAVGFTGSRAGGTALVQLAAARPVPIPVYAEMSSVNPVVIFPGAQRERGPELATGLHASVTLGVGQFCTNPGLVFLLECDATQEVVDGFCQRMRETPPAAMLTCGILDAYAAGTASRAAAAGIRTLVPPSTDQGMAAPGVYSCQARALLAMDGAELLEEIFGPATLLVRVADEAELLRVCAILPSQLTVTFHGTDAEMDAYKTAREAFAGRAGRIIFNGFPTGVEVCHSMVHGGPFPATSDGRSTSVGTRAIERFVRPVCWQTAPQHVLPAELHDENPMRILRLVNAETTRNPIPKNEPR